MKRHRFALWFTLGLAVTFCNTLILAGRSWRLPSVAELSSLVDSSVASGALIRATVFPGTLTQNYWTSTTQQSGYTNAWNVKFDPSATPIISSVAKSTSYYVRCVATGP